MKKLLLPFLLVCCVTGFSQYRWQALSGAPLSLRFDDFHFINPDTGWLINPPYGTPLQYARVFRTYDGGTSWQQLTDSSNIYYRSVGFADVFTGWIGSLADTTRYLADTIPMYQTHDGGSTWLPVTFPDPHPKGICGISVVTDSIMYGYGRFFGPAGYAKTTDKGSTWSCVMLDSLAFGLIDGHFFNPDTGFITSMAADHKAAILYTTNAGNSWRYVYHSTRTDSDRVWKIFFPSRNIGYASIEYGGTSRVGYNTYFLKTTDGGLSWSEMPFMANYNEEGIGFINDSVGWIGGDFIRGNYVTYDGGNTWRTDESFGVSTPPYTSGTAGYKMNRFRSFGDTLMFASGNTVYKLNSATLGIGLTNRQQNMVYNYPNPFKDKTIIACLLEVPIEDMELTISDECGKAIYRKNCPGLRSGNNQFVFTERLPAGVYQYSLSNGKFKFTNKMVIIP